MPQGDGKDKGQAKTWSLLWDVFDQCVGIGGSARRSRLDALCQGDEALRHEVDSLLLAYDRGHSLVDKPFVDLRSMVVDEGPVRPEIERYQLLDLLGSGGMGYVFSARRTDGLYDELVAVKVLKRGLDTDALIRRFHAERRILARLAHPNIARILDGGSTLDGRPYLVMERVVGIPIDRYCNEHRLSIAERLSLLRRVSRVVHFAHRNLVIHRDLKPGNILVDETGEPKLLDFGIAKLLSPDSESPDESVITEPGQGPMTPRYASPEQILGRDTSTASDVYSLGVLLYELLTGTLPDRTQTGARPMDLALETVIDKPSSRVRGAPEGAPGEVNASREISEHRNTTPASLRKILKGDLDNIVLMALAKDPEERYASAEALAADLESFADGQPVRAQVDTWRYRARKFLGRHRLAVAITVTVVGALNFLLAVLLVQRGQILDERDRVVEERNRATIVSDFLVQLFAIPDPTRARGETVTARQLLERGVEEVEMELSTEPRIQGALMLTMGRSQAGLGLYDEALVLLRRSLELRQGVGESGNEAEAESLFHLAETLSQASHYEEAEPMFRQALEMRRRIFDPGDPRVVEVHVHLGKLLARRGHLEQAGSEYAVAESLARAAGDEELLTTILDRRASLLQSQGDLQGAAEYFDEALTLARHVYGDTHTELALILNDAAWLAAERGDFESAESLYREAEAMQRRLFDGAHPQLATTLANLGLLHSQRSELANAQPLLTGALNMLRETLGHTHPKVATTLSNLAALEAQRGEFDLAETHYLEVLEIQEEILGPEHAETANTLNNLAQTYSLAGRLDEASRLFRRALAASRRALGPDHPRVGAILANLAELAQQQGELESAQGFFNQAIEILRHGESRSSLAAALINLASLEQAQGRLDTASVHGEEAVEVMRQALGESHPEVAKVLTRLASLHSKLNRHDEAVAEAEEALEIFRDKLPMAEAWIAAADRIRIESGHQASGGVPR